MNKYDFVIGFLVGISTYHIILFLFFLFRSRTNQQKHPFI